MDNLQNKKEETIFSKSPIKQKGKQSKPLIVVGLPRSGSSFLAYALSHIEDWYVFDDLYLYRKAASLGAIKAPLTGQQLDDLIFFLGWQIRARIKFSPFTKPKLHLKDVDRMDEALKCTFQHQSIMWYELLEEWMLRLAQHHGCSQWGYKAPQDFMNIKIIKEAFPAARFIYLHRDPRDVMSSLKNVHSHDGNPWQYHPVIYPLYWQFACQKVDSITKEFKDLDVLEVRYSSLKKDIENELTRISSFLESGIKQSVDTARTNSSFQLKKKIPLTPTELWLCEYLIGKTMLKKGYTLQGSKGRFRDFPHILLLNIYFSLYQINRLIFKKEGIVSIILFFKSFTAKMLPRSFS